MSYMLVEPCAGTAALSMHMLGKKESLVPYQGNKWKYRKKLEKILNDHGFSGRPRSLFLNDPGPWGVTWSGLMLHTGAVLDVLEEYEKEDPKDVFLRLHGKKPSFQGAWKFAAEFLFLQRLSFSGKCVTTRWSKADKEFQWCSPGFNKTSAYGKAATDRFGAINPMLPCLIRRVSALRGTTNELQSFRFGSCLLDSLSADRLRHFVFDPVEQDHRRVPTAVYVDPPYQGTTEYGCGLRPGELLRFVRMASDDGCFVMVSENKPIPELVEAGWQMEILRGKTQDGKPFQSKKTEVVMHNGHLYNGGR